MRLLFPIVGAIVGAALSIFVLGNTIGNAMMGVNQFESPDEAATTHAFFYLFTLVLLTVVGFIAGWLLSNVIYGSGDPWEQDPDYEP